MIQIGEFKKGTGNCEFCRKPMGQDKKKMFLTIQSFGKDPDESVLFT
jgi:hypothetical protein